MPLVSVIMPSYNHAKYLPNAIESVLGQSFTDFELIIIDDGSVDRSQQIIEDYEKKDSRIQSSFHTKNKGITKTFNELIDVSNGKFISGIASDDLWVKDNLKKQLEVIKQDENLITWTEGEIINAKGISTGKNFTEMYKVSKKSGNIFEEILGGNFIFGSSWMCKSANLSGIRFDENLKYLNDHKFFLDLASKYQFYFIPEPLAKYRLHGKNTIFSDMEGWYKDFMVIGEYIIQNYGYRLNSKATRKKLFNLISTTPLYRGFKEDPWNKLNLIYGIILPSYALNLLTKNYFKQKINNN